MNILARWFGIDDLVTAVRESNARLEAAAQSLKAAEEKGEANPEKITAAIKSILQDNQLQRSLEATCSKLADLDSSLKTAGSRPIPVQTFPTSDDNRFEKEKQTTAFDAAKRVAVVSKDFIEKLKDAHQPLEAKMRGFFSLIDKHIEDGSENDALNKALKELLDCSPKQVIAEFQKHSLRAGLEFVQNFNRLIDRFCQEYPRCRAGIYSARLNYSEVIQFSDEIMSTLRATSTVLDDSQQRHDLLEGLQGELLADLQSTEILTIWKAIGRSFGDSLDGFMPEESSWWKKALGAPVGATQGVISSLLAAVLGAPMAQFQGQLTRAHRIKVFVATSFLLRDGWTKWSAMNREIVIPNLEAMFMLKSEYVANRLVSICDLVTANGYALDGLTERMKSVFNKST